MRSTRAFLMLAVMFGFTLGMVSEAHALSTFGSNQWVSGNACAVVAVQLDDLPVAQGTGRTTVRSYQSNCSISVVEPVGELIIKHTVLKRDANGNYAFCAQSQNSDGGYVRNSSAASSFSASYTPVRQCGNGYYSYQGTGYVLVGNSWLGGTVTTPQVWLAQ